MLTYAQELRHAFSLARALFSVATLHKLRGEADAAQEWAEAALAIITEQGFGRLLGIITFTRGWALAVQGRHEEGMAEMWQQQGKRGEARWALAEIYGWFTEGFDTPDLQETKALLEDLRT
jgi:hypothetical protein